MLYNTPPYILYSDDVVNILSLKSKKNEKNKIKQKRIRCSL